MLPSAVALLPTPAVNEAQQRILDRAEVDGAGCWLWTGWTNEAATPYGRLSIGNTKAYAHRTSYEAFVGPIPEGYEIDHLCQVSLCVNPEHLEAVTPEENRDRVTQRRTHCKRGHEFTEENTHWVRPGARACRPCRAWQDKVHKARKKGAPEPEPPLLPTPVTTDMGEGKTPERWDAWTSAMKAKHGNGNGHGASLSIEAQRHAQDWGVYEPAIRRWEQVLGRAAPPPTRTSTKGNPQLDPRFSEFLMGLPAGWVTDPAIGLNRVQQLRALGNGVVWQQCALATRLWLAWASEQAAS